MKSSWKEMSPSQKREALVSLVLAAIAMIFVILDMSGKWANNIHYLVLSALSLYEGIVSWNRNRKMAILEFVVAAIFVANAFVG